MPYDAAILSKTASQLINLQQALRNAGESRWVKGGWEHTGSLILDETGKIVGQEYKYCLMGWLAEANGKGDLPENHLPNELLCGSLKGATQRLYETLGRRTLGTILDCLTSYNDEAPTRFEHVLDLVDRAVEAEVKECLAQSVTVGS